MINSYNIVIDNIITNNTIITNNNKLRGNTFICEDKDSYNLVCVDEKKNGKYKFCKCGCIDTKITSREKRIIIKKLMEHKTQLYFPFRITYNKKGDYLLFTSSY